MRTLFVMLITMGLLVGGCGSSQKSSSRQGYDFSGVEKVAVVSVEGALRSEVAKDQIADFFAMELLEHGYAPVGRAQVRSSLKKQEVDLADLGTTERAVEVGKLLDVPAVLAIDIPHFGEQISITGKMINVADGSILWLSSGRGKGKRTLSNVFGLSESSSDSSAAVQDPMFTEVIGGAMGDLSKQPLSPEEARRAQSVIKKMCTSLPKKTTPEW